MALSAFAFVFEKLQAPLLLGCQVDLTLEIVVVLGCELVHPVRVLKGGDGQADDPLSHIKVGVIDLSDVFAVIQGLKRLKLETVESCGVDSDEVFSDLQHRIDDGRLSNDLTTSAVYFEASVKHPGMLDRVNTATGMRQTGQFRDGEFHALTP